MSQAMLTSSDSALLDCRMSRWPPEPASTDVEDLLRLTAAARLLKETLRALGTMNNSTTASNEQPRNGHVPPEATRDRDADTANTVPSNCKL